MRYVASIAVLGSLIAVGSTASLSLAAAPEARPERQGRAELAQSLGLSPEQSSEMARLRAEFHKAQIKRRAEIELARIELGELLRAPQLDEKAVSAKARLLGDLEAAQIRDRIEHRLAMAKVLTPEQRQKARGWLIDRHGPRGARHGRHGHGSLRGDGGAGPRWHGMAPAPEDAPQD